MSQAREDSKRLELYFCKLVADCGIGAFGPSESIGAGGGLC